MFWVRGGFRAGAALALWPPPQEPRITYLDSNFLITYLNLNFLIICYFLNFFKFLDNFFGFLKFLTRGRRPGARAASPGDPTCVCQHMDRNYIYIYVCICIYIYIYTYIYSLYLVLCTPPQANRSYSISLCRCWHRQARLLGPPPPWAQNHLSKFEFLDKLSTFKFLDNLSKFLDT